MKHFSMHRQWKTHSLMISWINIWQQRSLIKAQMIPAKKTSILTHHYSYSVRNVLTKERWAGSYHCKVIRVVMCRLNKCGFALELLKKVVTNGFNVIAIPRRIETMYCRWGIHALRAARTECIFLWKSLPCRTDDLLPVFHQTHWVLLDVICIRATA